jgi:glycerate 2-kinase
MRVLVAPDKFKGSLSATEVADNLAHGLAKAGADVTTLPLADGGDGSVAAALAAGMKASTCTVGDASGRPRQATIAFDGKTAVVEVANTCGLSTLPRGVLAPLTATSIGFGQAVSHAIELGARTVVLALGGSASTDGGIGMLSALGYTFHDDRNELIAPSASSLRRIRCVQTRNALNLCETDLIVACDVTNPLHGPRGAAAVFGPQKGATNAEIDELEDGLQTLVAAFERSGNPASRTWATTAGAGAAGGCGFAALALGARMVSGADFFLDLLDFDRALTAADLVVTGEGRLDRQTLDGKLPVVVARRAAPLPVVAVVGRNDLGRQSSDFTAIHAVTDYANTDTASDSRRTSELLRTSVQRSDSPQCLRCNAPCPSTRAGTRNTYRKSATERQLAKATLRTSRSSAQVSEDANSRLG